MTERITDMEAINPKEQIEVLRERLDLLEEAMDSNNPSVEVIARFVGRSSERLVSCFTTQ